MLASFNEAPIHESGKLQLLVYDRDKAKLLQ